MRFYILSLLCVFVPISTGFHEAMQALLIEYKRPYTVLDIGSSDPKKNFIYAQNPKATLISLPTAGHDSAFLKIIGSALKNIVLLKPECINTALIERLGRCEYPDIVIVHELPEIKKGDSQFIGALLSLGDFLCIKACKKNIEACISVIQNYYADKCDILKVDTDFCLMHTPKKGLDIARWNLVGKPKSVTPRYIVNSNFAEKKLIKKDIVTDYVQGFNLLTCTMLQAIYPTDKIIRAHIEPLKKLNHKDLVIGNFVVQGEKIVPIDFNDARRRGDAERCVKAALYFFSHDRRFKNMKKSLKKYEKIVQKKKSRKQSLDWR